MSCDTEINRDLKFLRALYLTLLLICISVQLSMTLSIPTTNYDTTTLSTNNSTSNSTDDDLYVIKAVVYEIGILTDADNTTDDTTERQEEVKLSFYNPPSNKSNGS